MKEILITRQKSTLKNIESNIPTPTGIFRIEWNLKEKNRSLSLDIPEGIIAKIDIESLGAEQGSKIKVNGKNIRINVAKDQYISLEAGTQLVEF
jgi:hypothetical protein